MYQALYRKWRPRSFDDVVGQQHITETLKRQLMSGRLSHAYLFVGTRGTGKTTCAKILARAANCEHPENGNPCNKCASCLGIESGAILDVEELDAASNNGVENIRALRDEAVFTPVSVRKRVYIVDEVHMLSTAAFNALLKILEEPPAHLIFILATTELHKVPATILSRCQRFSFKRITPVEIASRLSYVAGQEGLPLTQDAAGLLARLGDGSMRDALSLLDQCASGDPIDTDYVLQAIGLAGAAETVRLLTAIAGGDTAAALELLNGLYYNGKDLASVLEELMALCRDILMSRIAPGGGAALLSGNFSQEDIRAFSGRMPTQRLLAAVHTLQAALAELSRVSDRKTAVEMCLIQLCDESRSDDISALRSRLAQVEDAISGGTVVSRLSAAAASAQPAASQEAEPKSTPVPEPPAAPAVTVTSPSPAEARAMAPSIDTNAAWQRILDGVKSKIDIPPFTFLSDSTHAVPNITDGSVLIQAKSAIAKTLIDTTAVTAAVKEAAEKVLGFAVTVKVTDYDGQAELAADKLDALSRFANIKFE